MLSKPIDPGEGIVMTMKNIRGIHLILLLAAVLGVGIISSGKVRAAEAGANLVGKPLAIKFTAVDGKAVDLAKLRGKVVLIDYWATWCSPCVAELPHVKDAYDKLHAKGFEVVGISFDQDKGALTKFVASNKMEWPQYFDEQGWDNKFGKQFGIDAIPAMWLVDKKGRLRDLEGGDNLAAKVQKLLAE